MTKSKKVVEIKVEWWGWRKTYNLQIIRAIRQSKFIFYRPMNYEIKDTDLLKKKTMNAVAKMIKEHENEKAN